MATDYRIPKMDMEITGKTDPALIEEGANAFANELMCSQCAFVHGARMLGFDEDMALLTASGFGWGMQHGERCGAVTGSLMALGLKYGYRNKEEFANYPILKKKQAEFDRRFLEGVGALTCAEILRGNYAVEKEREEIYAEQRYDACELVMGYAISILEDLLNDTSDDAALIRTAE
ncbi:MAG: C_GCAxxG_C_C family protein [Firmicutes bacterium]|nr:C_GCAxxG_C_C family protein [Bacillota bacterium]